MTLRASTVQTSMYVNIRKSDLLYIRHPRHVPVACFLLVMLLSLLSCAEAQTCPAGQTPVNGVCRQCVDQTTDCNGVHIDRLPRIPIAGSVGRIVVRHKEQLRSINVRVTPDALEASVARHLHLVNTNRLSVLPGE